MLTTANSTRRKTAEKPAKPSPQFPLFAHNNGSWAKKIGGRLHDFGPCSDPDGAPASCREQADELPGRRPQSTGGTLTVEDTFHLFITVKKLRVDAGRIPYALRFANDIGRRYRVGRVHTPALEFDDAC